MKEMLNKPGYDKRLKMGPFDYDDLQKERGLEWRPLTFSKEGHLYLGQWQPNRQIKQGRGTFIYKDSGIYEGYFHRD